MRLAIVKLDIMGGNGGRIVGFPTSVDDMYTLKGIRLGVMDARRQLWAVPRKATDGDVVSTYPGAAVGPLSGGR